MKRPARKLDPDPLWYKDAIIYQVHVRSFFDSNDDGIGDFPGLTSKLDYIAQLGVTAIWLLPFYTSPLRDEGYDIASYTDVHPQYGTIKDFATFLREAHRRGLRVITELVINHTSDQHEWFQRARRAPKGSKTRDYYVWSDEPTRYPDARIIFKDFEQSNWTYDPVAKAYFWHRFYSHQPDLNFENPAVRREVFRALDFWMELGVDGFRLDAIPYLYEEDGTDCENLPQTHAFLKDLRRHVDERYPGRMLLAEANQWPADAAAYFGEGDECHMNFHFPLMPRLFMGMQMEDRFPIIDILRQTPSIPPAAQWAIFLRNHDELTLEMVTDEERDYMYRAYAIDKRARINLGIRRRLAPLCGNNLRSIELLHGLLLSLPGTPVLYYGDELRMGDNFFLGDRNGVRTPMQWSGDRNAGFSKANPQSLYLPVIIDPEYHFETINVEAQSQNGNSFLWWTRNAVAIRKRHPAFGRGSIEFLDPPNPKVLAYVREHGDDVVLVVANLSRFAQYVELDLRPWSGRRARELFGGGDFPPIGDAPWLVTLGPHSFYWLHLKAQAAVEREPGSEPEITADAASWREALAGTGREELEAILPRWLAERRWFAGKARELVRVELQDVLPVGNGAAAGVLVLAVAHYAEGGPETYLLPLAFAAGAAAEEVRAQAPQAVIARLTLGGVGGVLVDGVHDPSFRAALLDLVGRRRAARGEEGALRGVRLRGRTALWKDVVPTRSARRPPPPGRPMGVEQSNTSIVYDDALVLKLYRRVEEGTNLDLEIGLFLTQGRRFTHTPPVAGWLEYERGRGRTTSLASIHAYVPNEGDAWSYTLDVAERFLEHAATSLFDHEAPIPAGGVLEASAAPMPLALTEFSGPFLEAVRLLGQRTAEMHAALASDEESAEFRPERFTPFARRALYQSMRNLTKRGFQNLRRRIDRLPPDARADARAVLALEDELLEHARMVLDRRLRSFRTRIHGDFHLGQVLRTGRDFVVIDFEGEPSLTLGERRLKRSPLRDVAGMVRSFHYAAMIALRERVARRIDLMESANGPLPAWADSWRVWMAGAYLRAYLERARDAVFLAEADDEEVSALLDVHRMEKAIYELDYELNNRPAWARVPLEGLLQLWRETAREAGWRSP